MQHAAIVRSVTSPLGEHNLGTHYLLTGYPPTPALEYPVIGSVVAHLDESARSAAGAYRRAEFSRRRPAAAAAMATCRGHAAVRGGRRSSAGPSFACSDLDFYPGLSDQRIERRRKYLAQLDHFARGGGWIG